MKRFCSICNEEYTTITSETSSNYIYCAKCGYNKELALKHCIFDSIFKSIDTYLKNIQVKFIHNLIVDVLFENEFLVVKVNNIVLDKKNCPFELSDKDAYFFRNSVVYLIEDNLFIDGEEIQLNIDFSC